MKRAVAVLLASAMVGGLLTACGSSASSSTPEAQSTVAPAPVEPIKVTLSDDQLAAVKSFNSGVKFVDVKGEEITEAPFNIPETENSFPYLSQAPGRTKGNIDLESYGYEEAEYFLQGTANTYAVGEEGAIVENEANPYVNRVIVFRPKNAADFKGAVYVDILNASSRTDLPDIWRRSYDFFMRSGYIYVGITSKDCNVASLKKFDPERYEALNWKVGEADENGLFWDMLAQLGVEIKSAETPLLPQGYTGNVYTYLMGQSQSGWYTNTFNNNFGHSNYVVENAAELENGTDVEAKSHIFDGILNVVGGYRDAPINSASEPGRSWAPADASEVPFVFLVGENDYNPDPVRPDSDAEGDLYRSYVVAGAPHSNKMFLPDGIDEIQLRAGRPAGDHPKFTGEHTFSDLNMDVFVNAALENMHQWVSQGIPMPKMPSAEIKGEMNEGGMGFIPERDENGNMVSGIRPAQVQVPVASYYGGANDIFSTDGGSMIFLEDEAIAKLYKDRNDYLTKYEAAVDQLIADRWVLEGDKDLLMELAEGQPIFGNPGKDDKDIAASMVKPVTVEENLYKGKANVYGLIHNNVLYERRMYDMDYTNYMSQQIPENFNGEVVLDLITSENEKDRDASKYLKEGKAYIAITATPEAAAARGGNWMIPAFPEDMEPDPEKGKFPGPRAELGLVWDIISQTVNEIRTNVPGVTSITLGADADDADLAYTYDLLFSHFDGYGVDSVVEGGKAIPVNSLDEALPKLPASK